MKLYTEERVRQAYDEGFSDGYELGERDIDRTINSLTPIELPSDDDIKKEAEISFDEPDILVFYLGAKWIKQQILNQNK